MTETETQSILEAVHGINNRLDTVDNNLGKIETRLEMIDKDLSDLKDEVKTWSGRIFNLYNGLHGERFWQWIWRYRLE